MSANKYINMDEIIIDSENETDKLYAYFFGFGTNQNEFENGRIASEANIIGAIHNVRIMWEQFAQLVNYLLLDRKFSDSEVSLHRVVLEIATISDYEDLKQDLKELKASNWYKYVSSFSNVMKHRNLIEMSFNISHQWDGFTFSAFKYGGQTYNKTDSQELLEGIIDLCNRLIDCGNSLNEAYGI